MTRSMQHGDPLTHDKLFTLDAANAALPLVRAICRDMADLARELIDRRHRLDQLLSTRGGKVGAGDPYAEELAEMESAFEQDVRRLQGYVDELRELGVEPKSAPEGLVDFPSLREGRIVYLCWKLGEPRIEYWHELDAGFAGRQPLHECEKPGEPGKQERSVVTRAPSPHSTSLPRALGEPSDN